MTGQTIAGALGGQLVSPTGVEKFPIDASTGNPTADSKYVLLNTIATFSNNSGGPGSFSALDIAGSQTFPNAAGGLLTLPGTWHPIRHQNSIGLSGHGYMWLDQNNDINADRLTLTAKDLSQLMTVAVGGTPTTGDVVGIDITVNGTPFTNHYTVIGGDTTTTIATALQNLIANDVALNAAYGALSSVSPDGNGYNLTVLSSANLVTFDMPFGLATVALYQNPGTAGHANVSFSGNYTALDNGPYFSLARNAYGRAPQPFDQLTPIYFVSNSGPLTGTNFQAAQIMPVTMANVTVTGNTHGTITIDGIASTSGITTGMFVTATGIVSGQNNGIPIYLTTNGTTVTGVGANSVTLSGAALFSSTGATVYFIDPNNPAVRLTFNTAQGSGLGVNTALNLWKGAYSNSALNGDMGIDSANFGTSSGGSATSGGGYFVNGQKIIDGLGAITSSGGLSVTSGTIALEPSIGSVLMQTASGSGQARFRYDSSSLGMTISQNSTAGLVSILNADNSELHLGTNNQDVIALIQDGRLRFSNPSSFSANGSVATVLGSIGPVGSHTTVQEWLAVYNSSGIVRYIPGF